MRLKHIGLLVLAIVLAILYLFVNPNEVDFLPKCPLYATTGIYCPGCGSQRATHQLLNFNISGVLEQNVLYFIALLILAYHFIIRGMKLFFEKHNYNYIYHPYTPKIILLVVLIFWILRNIPSYPFELLAPK
jgi:hypothetical protein